MGNWCKGNGKCWWCLSLSGARQDVLAECGVVSRREVGHEAGCCERIAHIAQVEGGFASLKFDQVLACVGISVCEYVCESCLAYRQRKQCSFTVNFEGETSQPFRR